VSSRHEGDLLEALILATILQASTDHLDRPTPPDSPRAISIYALASALGQPRETVRRKVKHLIALGLAMESPGGVRVADGGLEYECVRRHLIDLAEITRDFLAGLAECGLETTPARGPSSPEAARALLLRATNTYCLRLIEDMSRQSGGDVMRPLLFSAITVANTRHIVMGPDSPYALFSEPLPDSLRRPVTALALAVELGLPRETTRRYLAKLEALGGCRRIRGGYIVTEAAFGTPDAQALIERIQANARRFAVSLPIESLALVGA
jgi:DNA-binding Lrp family transcriptional regulator